MTTTPEFYRQRFYGDSTPRRRIAHRQDQLILLHRQVAELHAYGRFLFGVINTVGRDCDLPFDGTAAWFAAAVEHEVIPRPRQPFPIAQTRQALLIYSHDTDERYTVWADQARSIGIESYCRWLQREHGQPYKQYRPDARSLLAMRSEKGGSTNKK